jgi:hypothetical protein
LYASDGASNVGYLTGIGLAQGSPSAILTNCIKIALTKNAVLKTAIELKLRLITGDS